MKLAIYDFDGTYMNIQVLPEILRFWKQKNLNKKLLRKTNRIIIRRYIFHKFGLFGWNKHTFRANAMSLTADLFRSIEKSELDHFLDELYTHLQDYINKDMKHQLEKDNSDGYYTILLSGNFNVILNPFLKEGFKEVIGSNVVNNNKIIKSEEVQIIIHDLKQQIIKDNFKDADFKNSKAYADSYYDLPILELVGNPVVVNPDKELTEIAKKRGYRFFNKKC